MPTARARRRSSGSCPPCSPRTATQDLDEADELAGRIGVLDHGRMVADGTAAELKRQIPGGRVDLHFSDAAALDSAARLLGEGSPDQAGLVLQVPCDGRARSLKDLLDRLDTLPVPEPAVSVHTPDLDDVFFALTGQPRPERDGAGQPRTDQQNTGQEGPR